MEWILLSKKLILRKEMQKSKKNQNRTRAKEKSRKTREESKTVERLREDINHVCRWLSNNSIIQGAPRIPPGRNTRLVLDRLSVFQGIHGALNKCSSKCFSVFYDYTKAHDLLCDGIRIVQTRA